MISRVIFSPESNLTVISASDANSASGKLHIQKIPLFWYLLCCQTAGLRVTSRALDWCVYTLQVTIFENLVFDLIAVWLFKFLKFWSQISYISEIIFCFCLSKTLVKSCLCFLLPVFEETKPCQCSKAERSYQGKWSSLFCVWVHEGKSLSVNERKVCKNITCS